MFFSPVRDSKAGGGIQGEWSECLSPRRGRKSAKAEFVTVVYY